MLGFLNGHPCCKLTLQKRMQRHCTIITFWMTSMAWLRHAAMHSNAVKVMQAQKATYANFWAFLLVLF